MIMFMVYRIVRVVLTEILINVIKQVGNMCKIIIYEIERSLGVVSSSHINTSKHSSIFCIMLSDTVLRLNNHM